MRKLVESDFHRILPTVRQFTVCRSKLEALAGTVHTSAKTHLTSVAIRIRNPDLNQNLIICSMAHCQASVKISCKSIWKFLCKVANRQTNKQRRLHNLGVLSCILLTVSLLCESD